MKLKDFTTSKRVANTGKNNGFCESCLQSNPDLEDGYTTCCNECCVDSHTALKLAKQEDIMQYLNTKFNVSSHGDIRGYNSKITFELESKKKSFILDMNKSYDSLITDLKSNIKGLKKEF